ncbi:unnamed protein product [Commensalibacter communis]|uniref:hypothetical protein n=1 Tax=Commensalibacter communis TaxID=2972786 RepID=UPI0022FF7B17|nr:hypothetical protein [Commensalibacter communis]CAI3929155.1 unnamed protein product [Commensalibacter communis]CAI3930095.1 unnamed protein product [Commensalibacter communis]
MDSQNNDDNHDKGEYKVHVFDLSSDAEDKVVEIIDGFYNEEHAIVFAHAYVRASVERCRIPGVTNQEIVDAWSAFGEDIKVMKKEETVWNSSDEIMSFVENVATPMECDWRSLDPRRLVEEDEFPEDDDE